MEKEFIPYELALRMKGLGFDEPCLAWYDGRYTSSINENYCKNSEEWLNTIHCATPLYQQAFRWFREKYGYYYQIGNSGDNTKFLMLRDSEMSIVWNDKGFNTYEEAELSCLEKLIEIVEGIESQK